MIAVSTLVVSLLPPRFESRTKLQIVPPAIPRVDAPYLNEIGSGSNLENQKELVKGRSVMETVVRQLQLQTQPSPSFVQKVKHALKEVLGKSDHGADPVESALADMETRVGAYYLKDQYPGDRNSCQHGRRHIHPREHGR